MTDTELSNIPGALKELRQWVCVYASSKIPMRPETGAAASASDPDTWTDFGTAAQAVSEGIFDYTGFVFAGGGLVGIDIDAGFDEDGLMSRMCRDIVHACASYTEKSRSGRGVHIIVRGRLPFPGRNNGRGAEIYGSGRYFIMTGRKLIYGDIADNQAGIDYVVGKYFGDAVRDPDGRLRTAKQYVPVWPPPENGIISLRPHYPEIGKGARNTSLFSLAGSMLGAGYLPDEILDELEYVNDSACSPPLSGGELRAIVRGIEKYRRKT